MILLNGIDSFGEDLKIEIDHLGTVFSNLKKVKMKSKTRELLSNQKDILPDVSKLDTIENIYLPSYRRDKRFYLGLTNFYRKFVRVLILHISKWSSVFKELFQ